MDNGFIKVAAATPKIKVGDCGDTCKDICRRMEEVYQQGVQVVVFPVLCV